jgi:hypothetical protein
MVKKSESKIDQHKKISKEEFRDLLHSRASSLRSQAELLLAAKNIRHSGTIIEDFIKDLFTQMFSSRFRITSGYIVSTTKNGGDFLISPEVDLIILDTLVPNILFPQREFIGKTEFVPKEAVVGIFQIKKTLNVPNIKKALENIKEIINSVGIVKSNPIHYNLGGMPSNKIIKTRPDNRSRDGYESALVPIQTNIFANPILGIIGLEQKERTKKQKDQKYKLDAENIIDLIFSFDGFIQVIEEIGPAPLERVRYMHESKKAENLNYALGYLTYYLYNTTGTFFSVSSYYFRP